MTTTTGEYDLAVAWNWSHDHDFLQLVQSSCRERALTTFFVDQENLPLVLDHLRANALTFRVALDRASDEDERFLPLASLLQRKSASGPPRIINPYDLLRKASDKATMHLEFLSRGLHVPYTIIISPYNHKREVELSLSELSMLRRPFIIKPANTTGGGIGVVTGAESLKDIIETRQHNKNDKYLLQEKIVPATLDGHRAWFRVFHAFGQVLTCWWDDQTHVYEEITPEQEERFGLSSLKKIVLTIQDVCGLDFFSSEVAVTAQELFVVVDYVNEICDMRLKSRHTDGVPDWIVTEIVSAMASFVQAAKENPI